MPPVVVIFVLFINTLCSKLRAGAGSYVAYRSASCLITLNTYN